MSRAKATAAPRKRKQVVKEECAMTSELKSVETANSKVLLISEISSEGTQVRIVTDEGIVAEYAGAMGDGKVFPSVIVFHDGASYWLADGVHRILAAKQLGRTEIACEVHSGSKRDALLYACGCNETHGLRRTQDDRRNAVETLLNDPEWSQWSDREIARKCDVSHVTVSRLRSSICSNVTDSTPDSAPRKVVRGGTAYVQDTANIGRSPRRGGQKDDEPEPGDGVLDGAAAREPGCDDDLGEPETVEVDGDPVPDEDQAYLDSISVRQLFSERCRAIFDRDALKHRKALKWLEQGKALGIAATKTGEVIGAWEYQVSRVLRLAHPLAWLKCGAERCVDGYLKDQEGEYCPACHGRGYRLP